MLQGKKFLGVNCDSNDAKFVPLSSSIFGGKKDTHVHARILWVAASPICIVTFTIGSVQHNLS